MNKLNEIDMDITEDVLSDLLLSSKTFEGNAERVAILV